MLREAFVRSSLKLWESPVLRIQDEEVWGGALERNFEKVRNAEGHTSFLTLR